MAKNAAAAKCPPLSKGKLKKQARQEAMRKEKERVAHLRMTAIKTDLLDEWAAFRHFERNGITATMESAHGSSLNEDDIDACVALQRTNLAKLGDVGAWDEGAARDALRHGESRVILMRGAVAASSPPDNEGNDDWVVLSEAGEEKEALEAPPLMPSGLLGYLHLQFCINEQPQNGGQSMLCVLNMQLSPAVMGLGLGKFAMQLVELIARRDEMELVMLCVKDGKVSTMRLSKQKPAPQQPRPIRHMGLSHEDTDDDQTTTDESEDEGFEVVSRPVPAAVRAVMAPAIKC